MGFGIFAIAVVGCGQVEEAAPPSTTVPDTTAPYVVSTSPSAEATGIPLNTKVSATFSEAMDSSTITTSTFTLTASSGVSVSGGVSYTNKVATFTPSANLSSNTKYLATIESTVKDSAGNKMDASKTWSFTTGTETFTGALSIEGVSPASNATNVSTSVTIEVAFARLTDQSSFNSSTFSLYVKDSPSSPISGNITFSESGSKTTAKFQPTSALSYNTTYEIKILKSVKDITGISLEADYTWSFATAATAGQVDGTAPTFGGLSSALALTSGKIILSWEAASDNVTATSSIQYLIYQGTSNITDFTTPVYTATAATTYVVSGLTASATYYFVIRARDAAGNTDGNTTEKSALTKALVGAPALIKPLDDDLTLDTTPTFDWGDVTGASTYQIQIDDNSDFSSVTQISTPTASTSTATTLSNSSYYWRVRAGDGDNWGSWSITRRLVVGSVLAKMNGDNYSDVLVGAYLVDVISTPGADRGQAYFYFGGDPMNTNSDVTVSGGTNLGYLGYTVAAAGDVNNDGFADALIGAWQAPAGGSLRGQAYLYFGANNLSGSKATSEADVTFSGRANEDYFSNSIASAGDVNNDGYMDVIIGAYLADPDGSNRGQAYIYFGGASPDNTADVTISGTENNGYLGYSVSSAGDVNNDGYADVIVGAYAENTARGRVYIYLGGASMDNTADVTIGEPLGSDVNFGIAVASAGDVNGDGYGDVIIGANQALSGGTSNGLAYIYFGGSNFSGSKTTSDANLVLSGGAANDNFGISVSSAGDVNNDGYSDVIVGANLADAVGGADRGRAYIYLGGASMDNTADVTFSGGTDYDYLGFSVSTAGDINNDGYSDVIVGAYLANGGGSDRGEAYIYFGGANMDNTADVTFNGGANNDYLGISVSGGK